MSRTLPIVAVLALVALAGAVPVNAFHLYRGPDGGCTPAAGDLTDDVGPSGPPNSGVRLLHNAFSDTKNAAPVSVIAVGDSVTWSWNSEHCHSIRATDGSFYSGYHYPAALPTSSKAPAPADALVAYPVPTLAPTLTYTHTFTEAGTYTYECEHHAIAGMVGVVVVQ